MPKWVAIIAVIATMTTVAVVTRMLASSETTIFVSAEAELTQRDATNDPVVGTWRIVGKTPCEAFLTSPICATLILEGRDAHRVSHKFYGGDALAVSVGDDIVVEAAGGYRYFITKNVLPPEPAPIR